MAADESRTDDPSKPPRLSFFRAAPAGVSMAPQGRRLGILSAAFNPVTRAHVALAQSAYHHYQLHEVLFVLPMTQPHKLIHDAPLDARLQMMDLAVQGNPAFSVGACTHGLFIDICRAAQAAYPPQTRLWFITGRDAAERSLTWPYPDPAKALGELFAQAELLVADRQGAFVLPDIPVVREHADHVHHLPLPGEYRHISATAIRTRLAKGEEVSELVPPPVWRYIQEHGLYQGYPDEHPA
ncbi:MAG: nicotinate-nicotinamide nucleotide adenylyltransferase [Candidatus Entotheonellia bacterium]